MTCCPAHSVPEPRGPEPKANCYLTTRDCGRFAAKVRQSSRLSRVQSAGRISIPSRFAWSIRAVDRRLVHGYSCVSLEHIGSFDEDSFPSTVTRKTIRLANAGHACGTAIHQIPVFLISSRCHSPKNPGRRCRRVERSSMRLMARPTVRNVIVYVELSRTSAAMAQISDAAERGS
jgi:hypothetical protein